MDNRFPTPPQTEQSLTDLDLLLQRARVAARELALKTSEEKNRMLLEMATALEDACEEILAANKKDVAAAKGVVADAMIDRLLLNKERIFAMAKGIKEVALLPDPVGKILQESTLSSGLFMQKITVPLGVVAIIYESRPNVTSDAAALALKSGNACVLKGGKEAYASAMAIVSALRGALKAIGENPDYINMPTDASRQTATALMTASGRVDVLIPRGGAGLIRSCVQNATVPCIETGTGICHVYVDDEADIDLALSVVENAKTSRPSVCNAEEVLLVGEKIAPAFLPRLQKRLTEDRLAQGKPPVRFLVHENAAAYLCGDPATEEDFHTEFLDYILAVKTVKSVNEAILHIAEHSTHHSDCIITTNPQTAEAFLNAVDSAAVYHNASTRFTDGGEFGKGCEIGISTQKLHARGPMGLEELVSYKYVVRGNGQIR